jgi:hypothetical protein
MRFPVSREDGGNASALSLSAEAAAGNPSREERGARAPALFGLILPDLYLAL